MVHTIISFIHKKHVKGTEKGVLVDFVHLFFCSLTRETSKALGSPYRKVYLNTRSLKHAYDKRPAEEFDFFITHIHSIIRYPDSVYRNKDEK